MVKEGYKETEIGVVPIDWNVKRIKDIATPKARIGWQNLRKEEYLKNGDYLLITGTDFLDGKVILDKCCYVSKERYTQDHNIQVSNGAILITKDGTLGKVALVEGLMKPATLNAGVFVLNNLDACVNNYYLYQYLRTGALLEYALKTSTGGTIQHLNQNVLINFCVPCPPSEEQQKIAKALSDVDNLISSLEKLIEKKKAIKQGAIQGLLTGKKRLSGFTKQWEIKTIEELCYLVTKQTGFDYSNEIKPSLVNSPLPYCIPFIQNKDFEGTSINFTTDYYIPKSVADKYPKILLNETCLLISLSGKIGNVGLFTGDKLAFVGGAIGTARFYDKNIASWVMLYLQSEAGQKQIFESQKSGAQHNLTVEDVRKLKICLPSVDEQKAIASILFDMDAEITALEKKLAKCQKLKQGMMQQLLTGKIRLI